MPDLVAIGCAVVDVIARVSVDFLDSHGLAKGTMVALSKDQIEQLAGDLDAPTLMLGGSAANTAGVLAGLGGQAHFVGRIEIDDFGTIFREGMRVSGVDFRCEPAKTAAGTGRVIVLVTPDGDRTMCGYVGASAALEVADLDEVAIASSAVTLIEGYMLGSDVLSTFNHAIGIAHGANKRIALAASDAFCVESYRDEFEHVLESCDILFANNGEACALARTSDVATALESLANRCELLVVTHGPLGSTVVHRGRYVRTPAAGVQVVADSTGAGDAFAGGFLFGWLTGLSVERSVQIANQAAARTIGRLGAGPTFQT